MKPSTLAPHRRVATATGCQAPPRNPGIASETVGDANRTAFSVPCWRKSFIYESRRVFVREPAAFLTFVVTNSNRPPAVPCGCEPEVFSEREPQNRVYSM